MQGALIIEETFDYPAGAISGQNGGTGFAGAWNNTRNNPAATSPGLTWGDLDVAGNYARGNAWSGLQRDLGAVSSLDGAGLMANGGSLWFSVILGLEGQNTTNADINISLGTDQFRDGGGGTNFGNRENLLGTGAQGIGVTHSGGNIRGVYWNDVGNDGIGERTESGATSTSIGGNNPDYALILGRIDWGANDSADESLTLYAPGTDLTFGSPILGTWSFDALDQSAFDTLAIQFKDSSQVDEIRFGATAADVLPSSVVVDVVPEPTSFLLLGLGLLGSVFRRRR